MSKPFREIVRGTGVILVSEERLKDPQVAEHYGIAPKRGRSKKTSTDGQ